MFIDMFLWNLGFLLLFVNEMAFKMREKWDTTIGPKVINEAKHLTQQVELCQLLNAAEKQTENDDTSKLMDMIYFYLKHQMLLTWGIHDDTGLFHLISFLIAWDRAMAPLLFLLHLLPPTPGQKKTKISPSHAAAWMNTLTKITVGVPLRINLLSKSNLLSFDYGYVERKNRPTRINMDRSGNNIGLHSIKTLSCLKHPSVFR